MNKERLVAFTDAIIAIVVTLLVLELPRPDGPSINALLAEWRSLVIYIATFILIMVVWYNHHIIFTNAKTINRTTYWLNSLWLLLQSFIPFSASWLSAYPQSATPGIFYVAVTFLWAVSFQLLGRNIEKLNPDLIMPNRYAFPLLYISYVLEAVLFLFIPILGIILIPVMAGGIVIGSAIVERRRDHKN
ncbi:TMEM175 family protein [Lentilactobacillus sp. SPB1-3]|uniref:TMEM175 family protein n=1 Tax=Lentilactobacillus terminaliae TaxID=3003483 RepID=A0ACD5DEA9_9LACO|nr:TMEM175 family protein [Lentilactobacillus sp. SPB1-3]MCZ0977700.1 TMEM175 family protein [Lentilactobacillus sp. SPB1-3]